MCSVKVPENVNFIVYDFRYIVSSKTFMKMSYGSIVRKGKKLYGYSFFREIVSHC